MMCRYDEFISTVTILFCGLNSLRHHLFETYVFHFHDKNNDRRTMMMTEVMYHVLLETPEFTR
jgi:hypothetical protein